MIIIGLILLLLGYLLGIQVLAVAGTITLLIGLVLLAISATGATVGGRRYWF